MINPTRHTPTRMMGLSSGMDTDFIIQQTLRLHQFKIDNQMRNKKLIEWRQQTHNGIKDEISKLRSTFLSNLGSKTMMNRNVFNSTIASVTGKNAGAVSISTTTGTPVGSMKIGKITSLAKGASAVSGSSVSENGAGFSTSIRLDSLSFLGGQKITFTDYKATAKNVDGESVVLTKAEIDGASFGPLKNTLSAGGETVNVIKESNGTITIDGTNYDFDGFEGGVVKVTVGEQEFSFTKTESGDIRLNGQAFGFQQEATINKDGKDVLLYKRENSDAIINDDKTLAIEGETKINVNGKQITINSNDTIATMLDKVNKSDAGVTMSYNRLTDRFTIESKNVGGLATTDLDLSDEGTGNLFALLSGPGAVITDGSRAMVEINGETVIRDTNTFEYRGLRITLNDVTDGEEINVNFSRDTTKAVNAIKDFIDNYNSIIRRLEGLLSERKSSNEVGYKPLTDEEKQGMTDKQIDEWEAIAKKGLLRNDQGIQNLVSSLRRSFFEQIEGVGLSPSQIGLTTGSYFDGTGGQIMIDEEKLRAALEEDPDRVADIFVKIDNSGGTPKGVGLLHKIDGLMRDYVNTSQSTSLRDLENSLKRANDQIAKMQERMFAEEDRLYRQFAAMESAMSKLQQQGDWFGAMLGGK